MTVYHIRARCVAQPASADWREQLAIRLGSRPRRLGRWAELGLYGALECLAIDGECTLAERAAMVLSSQHGPALAMRSALAQAREDLPLPLTFLQTQPSQLLATLSAQLRWCGDARFITHRNPLAVGEAGDRPRCVGAHPGQGQQQVHVAGNHVAVRSRQHRRTGV